MQINYLCLQLIDEHMSFCNSDVCSTHRTLSKTTIQSSAILNSNCSSIRAKSDSCKSYEFSDESLSTQAKNNFSFFLLFQLPI